MQIDMWPAKLREAAADMESGVDSQYADVDADEVSAQRTVDGLAAGLSCQQAASSFTAAARTVSATTHEQVRQIAARLRAMADGVAECDRTNARLFTAVGAACGWDTSSTGGPAERVVADTDELYELQRWLNGQAAAMGTDRDGFDGSMTQLHSQWQGLAATAGDGQARRSSMRLQAAQAFVSDVAEAVRQCASALDDLNTGLSTW